MLLPTATQSLSGFEADDDFQTNDAALGKLVRAYGIALNHQRRANEAAVFKPRDSLETQTALWNTAVAETLHSVMELYLFDSPARGDGPHEVERFEFREAAHLSRLRLRHMDED